jgi:hypothetical protein
LTASDRCYPKLDADSRTEAVTAAVRGGLLAL